MPKTTLNLRVDSKLKNKAEEVIENIGISMTSAITVYLKAIVRQRRIPLDFSADKEPSSAPAHTPALTPVQGKKAQKTKENPSVSGSTSLKSAINKL